MRLLLDTHILLWAIDDSTRLSSHARNLLADETQQLVVSAVTIWEVAIKFARRRGRPDDMPMSGSDLLATMTRGGISLLAVEPFHAAAVDHLPLLHRDPFDRLLVAQAQSESVHLLTHDKTLAAYGDFVIVV